MILYVTFIELLLEIASLSSNSTSSKLWSKTVNTQQQHQQHQQQQQRQQWNSDLGFRTVTLEKIDNKPL